ncbi:hypothetical protein CEY02_19560 [Bacillus pumilus]|uniref:Uncharacterized protein n=1 Tax=Bacillus pumilus TaxID=1408 RepID=A0A2A5IK83_BACPU|nr:hypothetical protein [Bacillus pumilus]PCK17725.1 hypothetical protein CEY02_19560 [Bacillus pumilus]
MAKVKKHNRVLKVADAAVSGYLKRGYDQVDENGKVVRRATGGRTVALLEHNKALDEIESLKAQLAEAKQAAEKPAAKKSTKKE